MGQNLITAPTVNPILIEQVKDQSRITGDADLAYLDRLIAAATDWAENFTNRALITQTWELVCDVFPAEFRMPRLPLQSVTSIIYTDTAGSSQTLATTEYQVSATGNWDGRIRPAFDKSWPSTRLEMNAVTVRFVAGYGDSWNDVPEEIRHGMLMLVAELYERREDTIVGVSIANVPKGVENMLSPYRIFGNV